MIVQVRNPTGRDGGTIVMADGDSFFVPGPELVQVITDLQG